jgi:hypothetical protein
MRLVHADRDAVVVDDLLSPDSFAGIGREIAAGDYVSVHARGWDKAWRHGDGFPLRGSAVYYDPTAALRRPGARYPTSSVVDEFIDAVRRIAAHYPHVVGQEGTDWIAMFLSPWLYPVGSGLSLHRDSGDYSGAFTYFAHPRWGIHWGGELLLLNDEPEAPQPAMTKRRWMDEDEMGSQLATCVFPRPNRLVVIAPTRPHLIRRVDVNAGDRVRTSLAGFFLRS